MKIDKEERRLFKKYILIYLVSLIIGLFIKFIIYKIFNINFDAIILMIILSIPISFLYERYKVR
jgi:hypothetical protein